jgi:hypothetical protein
LAKTHELILAKVKDGLERYFELNRFTLMLQYSAIHSKVGLYHQDDIESAAFSLRQAGGAGDAAPVAMCGPA